MGQADDRLTLPRVLARTVADHPGVEAVVDAEVRLTYQDLGEAVHQAAKSLIALGVSHGDRVALWAPNGHRWVVAALAATGIGAILVPVNTRYKGDEARWVLKKSGARLLLVDNGFLGHDYLAMLGAGPDRTAPVPGLPALTDVVLTGGADTPGTTGWDAFLRLGRTVPDATAAARSAAVAPDDPSDLLFTSGTTGRPKGALTTHRQNLLTYRAWCGRTGLTRGDRCLIVNPLFHCFGYKAGVLACVSQGATMVLQAVFDTDRTMSLIETERITVLPGPPTLYTSLLDAPGRDRFDLTSLRLAVTGSAVVPVTLVRRMRAELFPAVLTAYGLTESCGTVTACSAGDDDETVALTVGRPLDGVEVVVVDSAGRRLPAGRDGEILVRGFNVMLGYLDQPPNAPPAVDPDGWLATGDIGRLDERGNLTITGRSKDMFVVGGFNVYPAEIEQVLTRHEAIAEAAVVGVPDARLGEVGRAYVTLRPGAPADSAELIGFCRGRLANFKVPREVVVLDAFPRNASGKIHKAGLRHP
ncbi:FadD3 family acyl-CoA ligase [Streptomyces sp. B-S-A8]|uniref:FadD3 family acyl-CoA ligase n=1 Tax=Streptomyces solicavernae TaxID=3043614 RepID=A0ABT6RWD5_9ACTN|nr:FadD3 family acyl-CoA ligase [Streptomyces sp. B-S-A8]MDI3388494.1 FadD3 family acyl-CoA ligase [Streptomyces sp. B-S-A8]